MSCAICGRPSCTRSFHPISEQQKHSELEEMTPHQAYSTGYDEGYAKAQEDATQSAQSEAKQSIPDGWALVPTQMTEEMIHAWLYGCGRTSEGDWVTPYEAMLKAAPRYVQQSIQQEKK